MEFLMLLQRVFGSLVLVVIASCGGGHSTAPSETQGVGLLGRYSTHIPKPKTAAELSVFKAAVHRSTTMKFAKSSSNRGVARENFRSTMLRALVDVDGMPREQLSSVVSGLLSDETACAGVRCSRIFGVDGKEVPEFLDETATSIESSKAAKDPQRQKAVEIMLGSLRRADESTVPHGSPVEPVFADATSAKRELAVIIEAEKSSLARMIRNLRYEINVTRSDNELFMTKNCGPASIALQKILADRGIYAEARVNDKYTMDHEYLLYRAKLQDGQTVDIVIDPTYRQFLFNYTNRQLFKNFQGGTIDDARVFATLEGYGLGTVLITEYQRLDATLAALKTKLPDFDYQYEIRFAYEKGSLDSALQREHHELLSAEQLRRLRQGRQR
jgi:hypothetical protein